jgi:hypothetical protein
MRSVLHKRTVVLAAALAVVAATLAAAGALAHVAPATPQQPATLWISAPSATSTGHDIVVNGGIAASADLGGAVVKIYEREVGESVDTYVGDATVTHDSLTGNTFRIIIPSVPHSCIISASWEGDADHAASSTWMFAGVTPRLRLAVTSATDKDLQLRITVSPKQPYYASGTTAPPRIAEVQCRLDGAWRRFPARMSGWGSDIRTYISYQYSDVKPGAYVVRVHFLGTNYNVASVSKAQRFIVR